MAENLAYWRRLAARSRALPTSDGSDEHDDDIDALAKQLGATVLVDGREAGLEDVLTRLQTGKPMSCFRTSNSETNEVHVAFTDGEERHSTVSYVTLIYDTSLAVQETGVHFCPFIIKTDDGSDEPMVTRTEKNVLRDEAVEYALLLPYQTDNTADSFVQFERFTLVYWDWEVLQPGAEANKGRPSADPSVFQGMNPERGDD